MQCRKPGRWRAWVFAATVAYLTACGLPSNSKYNPKPRADLGRITPPDVVVFAVSGRCGLNCDAPNANHDYLSSVGTVAAFSSAFAAQNRTTVALGYRSHLFNGSSHAAAGRQYGFLQLEADFDWVRRNWPNARRVLLGHSHGVNWTHNLLRLHPDWTVDYLIDLDGVCRMWEEDNADGFREYYRAKRGNPWKTDPRASCEAVTVQGVAQKYSVKDVAYGGATYNLEVRTHSLPVHDAVPNLRPDGSSRGISSLLTDEAHAAIVVPGSAALDWVLQNIAHTAFPGASPLPDRHP